MFLFGTKIQDIFNFLIECQERRCKEAELARRNAIKAFDEKCLAIRGNEILERDRLSEKEILFREKIQKEFKLREMCLNEERERFAIEMKERRSRRWMKHHERAMIDYTYCLEGELQMPPLEEIPWVPYVGSPLSPVVNRRR